MDVLYLGHSSFRLTNRKVSVVCDPFDPVVVGLKFPKVSATIVTISHDHKDHNNFAAVNDVKKVINGPGEYEIEGVSVIGISSFHDAKKGQERGQNTMYVIEMDGVRIAHLGDLGHVISESIVNQIGDIDVLMIPVGGEYTIGANEAAEVARLIEPNVIVPMHYQMPGLNSESFSKLQPVEPFISALGIKVESAPKLSIKADSYTNGDQIIWRAPLFK
ncbi:MAG: Zn-dependent hydrolase of the beta-lactamase fold-like protein [Candidatus Woesebacteria bacterium GW2011_GWB1_43_14]|uniref:Zn-dependent hydrolase of the beta-lactamase fold-like protein n=1 Tax=Candidatus Woesebacteria bacterium GW2011_GWB1_43_14 TaxID=1618578 RepID=A0A0G1DGG8_9BACT|nr:MAG: Zn-dependent hydrolase of the beta-lactamase fold-like protein [Candidatus Woesebacteria bacterium GW2011_GWC1_42_9]KKS96995.1 MAG: Zn-dependent hydrolase of the beta-lactamase fold-like protein [Candidatus Woesebacteria bacterium GW2011_GWB1_43_14]